jgi:hypothetical protein
LSVLVLGLFWEGGTAEPSFGVITWLGMVHSNVARDGTGYGRSSGMLDQVSLIVPGQALFADGPFRTRRIADDGSGGV